MTLRRVRPEGFLRRADELRSRRERFRGHDDGRGPKRSGGGRLLGLGSGRGWPSLRGCGGVDKVKLVQIDLDPLTLLRRSLRRSLGLRRSEGRGHGEGGRRGEMGELPGEALTFVRPKIRCFFC